MESIGLDNSEFHIPDSEVSQRVQNISYLTGERSYSDYKAIDNNYFLFKLDSILGYFEIITSDKPKRMGFSPPHKNQ